MIGRVKAGLLCLLALCVLLAGCEARTGSAWSMSDADSSSEDVQKQQVQEVDENGAPVEEESSSDESETEDIAQTVAENLIGEGLAELCINYNDTSFDRPEQINPTQMLWCLYWMDAARNGVSEKHDYDGYNQLSENRMNELVRQWFGPDAPAFEANEEVPIDKVNGEVVAYENGTYYFFIIEEKDEVFSELRSVSAENGVITIRFNTITNKGDYANTYNVKVRAGENGEYFLTSYNRGQSA